MAAQRSVRNRRRCRRSLSDRVDRAVGKAVKKTNKAIDKGDYDAVVKAINEGGEKIVEAVDS